MVTASHRLTSLRRHLAPEVALVLVTAVFLSACGVFGRAGEGPITSETRSVAGFTRIDVNNGIGVTVRIGSVASVEVSAQANILPIIATEVEGDTLEVHSTEGFRTSTGVGVTVVTPTLASITLSGGSQGVIEALTVDRLEIHLNGGAGLTASGTATAITLSCSGGSTARLEGLAAQTVSVDANGGASATVRASTEVIGSANGGARVTVLGDATLNVETSGGASVTRG